MNRVIFSVELLAQSANDSGICSDLPLPLRNCVRSPFLREFVGESPLMCREFPELVDDNGDIKFTEFSPLVVKFLGTCSGDEFVRDFQVPSSVVEKIFYARTDEESAYETLLFLRRRAVGLVQTRYERNQIKEKQRQHDAEIARQRRDELRRLQDERETKDRLEQEQQKAKRESARKAREESEGAKLKSEIRRLTDLLSETRLALAKSIAASETKVLKVVGTTSMCLECEKKKARREFAQTWMANSSGGIAGVPVNRNGATKSEMQYHGGRFHGGEW